MLVPTSSITWLAGAGGGWTIVENATTTNNFTLSLGSSFTLSSEKY